MSIFFKVDYCKASCIRRETGLVQKDRGHKPCRDSVGTQRVKIMEVHIKQVQTLRAYVIHEDVFEVKVRSQLGS